MAMVPLLCRLKVLPSVPIANVNETSSLSLIKLNTEVGQAPPLPYRTVDEKDLNNNNNTGRYSRDGDDVSRRTPPGASSLTINEDRGIKKIERETFSHGEGLEFALATIGRTWRSSNEPRPSAGYDGSSMRKLSTSLTRFSLLLSGDAFGSFSTRARSGSTDFNGTIRRFLSDSSSKKPPPSDKASKPATCSDEPPCMKEEMSKGCAKSEADIDRALEACAKKKTETSELCPENDPCLCPTFEPTCSDEPTYSTCPDVLNYCPPEKIYPMKFWRTLVLFIVLPLVGIMSILTYLKEKEKQREPREPFVDYPYLRRINKPFPWGDGKRTLFHNPVKNPISPDGYLVEDPYAENKPKQKD